ncbi:hypothetical protein DL93DRAFT_2083824 [Clavulina sp. PMI_390]|nr:hypothetical protein DL93DRAFT_2083824 [Clavulina sp. PMI_390]
MGLLGMFNVAVVQLFYARRGYLLNKSLWPFSLICVAGTLLSLGLGLATESQLPDKQWLKEFWYLGVIATDIMVTVLVVYALKLTAREYGFSGGLRGLVLYTIANGMLTIVVTMTAIILVCPL